MFDIDGYCMNTNRNDRWVVLFVSIVIIVIYTKKRAPGAIIYRKGYELQRGEGEVQSMICIVKTNDV